MDGKAGNQKGADLERRFARLEFADGALVRTRWPVTHQISGRRRSVTDVDVLSVDFSTRLQETISIAECKSARGQSGEQDRLLWLFGLRGLVGAHRAVLVRDTASAAGRDISRRLTVDLMSVKELERREVDHQWVPDSFGLIGETSGVSEVLKAGDQMRKLGELPPAAVAFLRHDSILAEPHKILGAIMSVSDALESGPILPEPAGRILASDALFALLLAALRTAGRLDLLGTDGARRELENGLATGDPHDQQVMKVIDLADSLLREQLSAVHRAYARSGARPIEIPYIPLRREVSAPPSWIGRFIDLADRCRSRGSIARQLPQVADLALFDAMSGGAAWGSSSFDHLFTPQHRQLLAVALGVLNSASPVLSQRLERLLEIPFDRAPAAVPDRFAAPPDQVTRPRSATWQPSLLDGLDVTGHADPGDDVGPGDDRQP